MESFATALDLRRTRQGPDAVPDTDRACSDACSHLWHPARFLSPFDSPWAVVEAAKSISQVDAVTRAAVQSTRFVARAVFHSLLGAWRLERDVHSKLASYPSGHFSGTARFLARRATADGLTATRNPSQEQLDSGDDDDDGMDGRDPSPVSEYLYVEQGQFRSDAGLVLTASRQYVWRYDELADTLSVWFVRLDDPLRADYLFHDLAFAAPAADLCPVQEEREKWTAEAGHQCRDDFYRARYAFSFRADHVDHWSLAYDVKGPAKDHTIRGHYHR